jgi:NAD(P)-dependent dehydrogenase (short-subunit alcohol dehydrogenase family)
MMLARSAAAVAQGECDHATADATADAIVRARGRVVAKWAGTACSPLKLRGGFVSAERAIPEQIRVTDVVAFLCSPRARFMTDADVHIDGGMTVTYGAD